MRRVDPKSASMAAGYGLLAVSVWLAFEIVKAPLIRRAPPAIAVRLAPQSPELLGRLAEAELAEERFDNAKSLADEALVRAPFNIRALRVRGLAEAKEGSPSRADEIMTLAGNWSLRDTDAHAWLLETRLRQGDYVSAFAHADTIIRRRPQVYPQVFALFSTAASADARALPALVRQLDASPPWRGDYLISLVNDENVTQLQADLTLAMQARKNPLTNTELGWFYTDWLKEGRLALMPVVRDRIKRPLATTIVQNSRFDPSDPDAITPFDWTLSSSAGLVPELLEDDLTDDNTALRVSFDGYGAGVAVAQTLLLSPGLYKMTGRFRRETQIKNANVRWTIDCVGGGSLGEYVVPEGPPGEWSSFDVSFAVTQACNVAQVRLTPVRSDRRGASAIWFDDIAIDRQKP